MLKFLPIILIIGYALAMWRFSSRQLSKQLDATSTPLDDPSLEAMAKRLGRVVDVPHLRAFVVEQPVFNGLAAPDGRIFITRGVVDKFRRGEISAEEVGSILAHELGHVALGHSKRRMLDWTGQNAARVALSMVLNRIIPGIGIWIANGLISLLAARLSRRDEFEADAYAAALMRKAGMQAEAWLLSHPPIPKRVEAIRGLHASWDARG
jgi:putative metalloprotease